MLAGKAALVTGSTTGIGLAMLRALAGAGANVTLHGLLPPADLEQMQKALASEFGVKVASSHADLRKPKEIRDLVHHAADAHGSLDILVNNAGIQHVCSIEDFPEKKWDDIIAICLSAPFHATKFAVPIMEKTGWGRIINTGSMQSLVAVPYKSAYAAAKHGVAGFSKAVALELARKNITVNTICPGYAFTDLIRHQLADTAKARGIPEEDVVENVLLVDQPTKQFVQPADIGALVLHLCGPHSSSITGACLSIDGGWTAR